MNLPDASLSPTPWTPPWHLVVHHLASEPQASMQRAIAGRSLKVLQLEPWQQSHEFHRTFDGVLAAINTELGGYVEGDGSFVWRPQPGPDGSFIEGNLFDGDQNLRHVELKGRLSRGELERFLKLLGWPDDRLVIQFVTHGLFLGVDDFLSCIATA